MAAFGFNTPFAEQLAFFRAKLNLPTRRWNDIERGAHDRAFIVAGAGKADLLADLRAAVDKAINEGGGIGQFRKDFRALVQKNGWTGWTGEGSKGGEAWRTKVIYQTNMATSYAAGRYAQLTDPEFLKLMPYWHYVHADGVMHPRPLHLAWDGTTLPHDHPFWRTHFAPNGWGCHCRIVPVGAPGPGDKTAPPQGWDKIDPKTGVQVGIDKGFDYAPGANANTPLQRIIDQKLIKLDAPIGAAMMQILGPVIQQEMAATYRQWLQDIATDSTAKSVLPVIGAIDPVDIAWLQSNTKPPPATAEISIYSGAINGPKAARHAAKGDAVAVQVWENLPEMLREPLAVFYDETRRTMLYVLADPSARRALFTVEFDYLRKVNDGRNVIVSGYRPLLLDLKSRQANRTITLMRGSLE